MIPATDLKADELGWFANAFLLDFAKASIAIENFSSETYKCFYVDFWNVFKDFLHKRMEFDVQGTLNKTYNDFRSEIDRYIPNKLPKGAAAAFENMPVSGANCIDQLNKLRRLEER